MLTSYETTSPEMKKNSTRFITFGAGSQNHIDAGNRLLKQANNTGLFDNISMYTQEYLALQPDFHNRHSEFIKQNSRGFGYWLWKPYIIRQTMSEMNDGDVLLYLDCGCEIDVRKVDVIRQYIHYLKTEPADIMGSFALKESDWTKADLVNLIGATPEHMESKQYQAGALLLLVCPKTRNLVEEWYTLSCDYQNIDDSPSQLPNDSGFREHRHDQSIFSLLAKKYNIYSHRSLGLAVEYIRNKTGVSKLQFSKMFGTNDT